MFNSSKVRLFRAVDDSLDSGSPELTEKSIFQTEKRVKLTLSQSTRNKHAFIFCHFQDLYRFLCVKKENATLDLFSNLNDLPSMLKIWGESYLAVTCGTVTGDKRKDEALYYSQ